MDAVLALIEEKREFPVIVEGKRDRVALERLGFVNIFELDKPLFAVVEQFNRGDSVLILTDLDKKGKELYGRLKKDLSARGVRVDDSLRDALFQTELSHIEGLYRFIERNKHF